MPIFEVTYCDGSCDRYMSDSFERVGDEWHFVRAAGGSGAERAQSVLAERVRSIKQQAQT